MICCVACCTTTQLEGWSQYLALGPFIAADTLQWQIPMDPVEDPCPGCDYILSKLDWDHLMTLGAQLNLRTPLLHPKLIARLDAQAGALLHGTCWDYDWMGPNCTVEFSRSLAQCQGYSASGQLSFGWQLGSNTWSLIPFVGVDAGLLHLGQRNLKQIFSMFVTSKEGEEKPHAPEEGEAASLEDPELQLKIDCEPYYPLGSQRVSEYEVRWIGPMIGGTFWGQLMTGSLLELHGWAGWAQYRGDADWCLRDTFLHPRSFIHEANIFNWSLSGTLLLMLRPAWTLQLQAGTRRLRSDEGKECMYMAKGEPVWSRVLNLSWRRSWGNVSLGYRF